MKKDKKGIMQFIKFALVGVSNTLVDWAVFYILALTVLGGEEGEPLAKGIAFVVAVINSFVWNSVWTFKDEFKKSVGKDKIKRGGVVFVRFVIVSLVGWVVNYYTFKYTRFTLSQASIVALIAASGAATLWNFFANKLWTYK